MKKFIKESNHFLKIGIPILGSQLSYMIMYTTDTIVAGRYGADELSGLVIANSFTFPIYMLFQGVMFAITPIVAQLYGAKKYTQIGEKMRQIFWTAISLAIFIQRRNDSNITCFYSCIHRVLNKYSVRYYFCIWLFWFS